MMPQTMLAARGRPFRRGRWSLPFTSATLLLFHAAGLLIAPPAAPGATQELKPITSSGPPSPYSDFEAGNKFYEEGKFPQAVAAYEKVFQSGGGSAAAYFNLGNAYFKSRQIGRAIAAYRQAERLTPRDPDVRANLRFARNQVAGPTLATGKLRGWITNLNLNEWALVAAACFWILFLALAFTQLKPAFRRTLRNYIVAGAAGCVLSGAGLGAAVYVDRAQQTAFAVEPEIQVRQGPLDESKTAFVVHDGAEMLVLDRKDDWLQVSTDPRRSGWIRKSQVLVR
jgi:tetratricopeptide (TPR) repeat protein